MVAEPDTVKLIRILPTETEFVVVLKLGDDTDVWARTFSKQEDASAYADVCAAMLNGEDVEYIDPEHAEQTRVESADELSEEADMDGGNDEADSWDDWDDDSTPEPEPEPKEEAEADSWDDWDDDSTPEPEPKKEEAEADSWDDWDDDSTPEPEPKPKKTASKSKKGTSEKGKTKNTVKADIQQAEDEVETTSSKKGKTDSGKKALARKRRRSTKRREALSFTPVDEDSDAWSPEWGDDSAEDWHDD